MIFALNINIPTCPKPEIILLTNDISMFICGLETLIKYLFTPT